ncbi:hypothetical protein PGT21_005473 [Puccinia graminis f. sp. tritici]|uniref:Uncharacterized protein n=1 Tax=Puccinia graminis f. sp. tritici TaxID=56615 RepID=A0A5B0NEY3_PUCGR|nr:hypothetical protein PGT21_005473 [Puccinia graminis f. sp. tritici]
MASAAGFLGPVDEIEMLKPPYNVNTLDLAEQQLLLLQPNHAENPREFRTKGGGEDCNRTPILDGGECTNSEFLSLKTVLPLYKPPPQQQGSSKRVWESGIQHSIEIFPAQVPIPADLVNLQTDTTHESLHTLLPPHHDTKNAAQLFADAYTCVHVLYLSPDNRLQVYDGHPAANLSPLVPATADASSLWWSLTAGEHARF